MKVLLVGATVVMCVGVGVYAQTGTMSFRQTLDPVDIGGLYRASFCGGAHFSANTGVQPYAFFMRVTGRRNSGWFAADVSYQLGTDGVTLKEPEAVRINSAALCFTKALDTSRK